MKLAETYHIAFYRDDADGLPAIGAVLAPSFEDLYRTMCDIKGVHFEVTVTSHFQGDPVSGQADGKATGFVGTVRVADLPDDCKAKVWHRGLLQLLMRPVPTALEQGKTPAFPHVSNRQIQVVAFATSKEVDLTDLKQWWQRRSEDPDDVEELLCIPWKKERADWQPIDYAYEWSDYVYRLGSPRTSDLNLYSFLLVEEGSAAPEDRVVKVVVPWRQSLVTFDPIRTFRARLPRAHAIISAMGGLQNPRQWQPEADEQLFDNPDTVVQ
ncbi:hypothetical protein FA10DRAFT_282287 [Acaromyces ingoldii]|uniref:Uncharacterized protein n=1 Tax=Acaromyces ingoldii TaxID=215250 RepID=A0A316YUZ2_9BASI|nr:hypothetical protein FA10DRAFT_282287 [Acaromyces ingoldii]PWN92604.1 hypothetical protein FA10DRAFT_282287 [Acaromyces ingoldii]